MTVTAALYRRFAHVQARGESPIYERLALAVAADEAVLDLLDAVQPSRRQPKLLFGALRWHDIAVEDPAAALGWTLTHPGAILEILRTRRTQTNEVGRCALHLPALARLRQPIALVEVGASAGLCLLADRWWYRFSGSTGDRTIGAPAAAVRLDCAITGPVPLPPEPPTIAWRAGLDLDPIDDADPAARRWLRCLVWPEHEDRAGRLDSALRVAAEVAPRIDRGNLIADLPALLDQMPRDATPVVLHSATLTYLDPAERAAFRELVVANGAHRVGCEGVDVLPDIAAQLPPGIDATGQMLLSLDDRLLGIGHPHGRSLTWLP